METIKNIRKEKLLERTEIIKEKISYVKGKIVDRMNVIDSHEYKLLLTYDEELSFIKYLLKLEEK